MKIDKIQDKKNFVKAFGIAELYELYMDDYEKHRNESIKRSIGYASMMELLEDYDGEGDESFYMLMKIMFGCGDTFEPGFIRDDGCSVFDVIVRYRYYNLAEKFIDAFPQYCYIKEHDVLSYAILCIGNLDLILQIINKFPEECNPANNKSPLFNILCKKLWNWLNERIYHRDLVKMIDIIVEMVDNYGADCDFYVEDDEGHNSLYYMNKFTEEFMKNPNGDNAISITIKTLLMRIKMEFK